MEKNQPNNKMQQQIEETLSLRRRIGKIPIPLEMVCTKCFFSFDCGFFLSAICHTQIRGKDLPSDQTRRQHDEQ